MRTRLDQALAQRGLVTTRSQASSFIRLGEVKVDGQVITKPGFMVAADSKIVMKAGEQYVSRAALKLASVVPLLGLDFRGKVVLDVGSSTGGFTDYALRHGAERVIAVEVGSNQMHPSLLDDPRIELHEQTDIRDLRKLSKPVDIVVMDVSFVSLRDILPAVNKIVNNPLSQILAMVKPQFEAVNSSLKHKGVIKNDTVRRTILKDFEVWVQKWFVIVNKADSEVAGAKGNLERFYLLEPLKK